MMPSPQLRGAVSSIIRYLDPTLMLDIKQTGAMQILNHRGNFVELDTPALEALLAGTTGYLAVVASVKKTLLDAGMLPPQARSVDP